jgi:hypothetical protein
MNNDELSFSTALSATFFGQNSQGTRRQFGVVKQGGYSLRAQGRCYKFQHRSVSMSTHFFHLRPASL